MKAKLLALALVSSLVLCSCASNTETTQNKKTVLPWMKKVECVRSSVDTPATITLENLSLAQNTTGCYGSDKNFCNIRMYQIMVESFKHGENGASGYTSAWGPSKHDGNLRGIIDSLDYIKSTGVNAIWLTPIFETKEIQGQDASFNKLDGTGYFTSDYFAIDPKFGTKKELIELVNKAHSKGMYVMLDGVFGHAKVNMPEKSPKGNTVVFDKNCRQLLGYKEKLSLQYGTCFDVEKSLPYLKEIAEFWINEVKIDGYRLDQAYNLDGKAWKEIQKSVEKASKNKKNAYKLNGKKVQPLGYMVAEYWTDKAEPIEMNVFKENVPISVFDFPTRAKILQTFAIKDTTCSLKATALNDALLVHNTYTQPAFLNSFLSNHDVLRLGDAMQRAGYEQDGQKGETYYDAHRAALSFIASLSGPLTLYYGDEYGDDLLGFVKEPGNCGDVDRCDDHVSRTQGKTDSLNQDELALKEDVAKMLSLRDSHPALERGTRTHIYSDDTLYVDLKESGKDKVIYVLNVGLKDRKLSFSNDALGKLNLENCTFENLITNESVNPNELNIKRLSGSFFKPICK
ncbi:MAG: alpha-amylase family glycosyl hydrolase [Ruminobacter sp.]|nr:alpha-amylase family glycosyl hydrolase [Ruminobacter sp.]MDY5779918.1 alpha-amylase family glycosyl hydrolase [Succinivibrionaceae bacterium]